ncbi:MAG: hypothetical protein IPH68_03505 [Chitinophagaceae bacterium]|nr:hypothetical protein [Chitinophagaceae bacterium]
MLDSIPFSEYDLTVINQGGWEEILHTPFKNLYKKLPGYILINHNYNEQAVLSFQDQRLLRSWMEKCPDEFWRNSKNI